jgi:hypothetical protein
VKLSVFFATACSALLLSLFVSTAQAKADTVAAAPTPVPYAVPDFSSMQIFMGNWTCTQTLRGKNRTDTSTTTMGMDGQWMVTHDVAPPFDQYRTQPITSDTYMTYNSISKLWVSMYVDNFGGYGVSTSPGWQGNTMTSTSVVTSDGSTGSDVLTKVSDTETTDQAVSTDSNGTTHTTTTCKKTG